MADPFALPFSISRIILVVARHYGRTAAAFSRRRMLASEAANIASTLKIQRLIFRAANRTLLGHCVGEELAAQMQDNESHLLWVDRSLEVQLRQKLGDSLEAATEALKLIEEQLQRLDRYRQKLESTELETKQSGDGCVRTSSRSTLKKLKFAYAKVPFKEVLDCLRGLTQDFRVLIEQTTAKSDRRKPDSRLSEAIDKSTLHFRNIQAAAKDLYAALSSICMKNGEYHVYLAIQPTQNASSPEFQVGIDCSNSITGYIGFSNGPLWLKVRSTVAPSQTSDFSHASSLVDLVDSVKRKNLHEALPDQDGTKRAKKIVRFRSISPPPPTPMAATEKAETFPNPRDQVSDICGLLKGSPALSRSESMFYVLNPEYAVGSKYLLSLSWCEDAMPRSSKGRPWTLISLASLFARSEKSKDEVRLSFFDRVRLARLLATAVLRYHATPWLKYTLCSADIFLYRVESSVINTISIRNEVYLKTSVKGVDCHSLDKSPPLSRPLVRNPDIFALGVLLLELAFEAPLHSLQKPTDVDSHEDQNTDYYIADRVRRAVSRMLGPTYADLVRKCIHCDFGRGNDLSAVGLQESFYIEIVKELEDLEGKFSEFGLGSRL